MSTKDEQYNAYCKVLHTEKINLGLICNDGKKNGRSIYKGNLVPSHKPNIKLMTKGTEYNNCGENVCKDIYYCKLCDKQTFEYISYHNPLYGVESPAYIAMSKHITDHHYEYCFSCDCCNDYFPTMTAFNNHMCKVEKGYDIWT